jgi:hypothetical protein
MKRPARCLVKFVSDNSADSYSLVYRQLHAIQPRLLWAAEPITYGSKDGLWEDFQYPMASETLIPSVPLVEGADDEEEEGGVVIVSSPKQVLFGKLFNVNELPRRMPPFASFESTDEMEE